MTWANKETIFACPPNSDCLFVSYSLLYQVTLSTCNVTSPRDVRHWWFCFPGFEGISPHLLIIVDKVDGLTLLNCIDALWLQYCFNTFISRIWNWTAHRFEVWRFLYFSHIKFWSVFSIFVTLNWNVYQGGNLLISWNLYMKLSAKWSTFVPLWQLPIDNFANCPILLLPSNLNPSLTALVYSIMYHHFLSFENLMKCVNMTCTMQKRISSHEIVMNKLSHSFIE